MTSVLNKENSSELIEFAKTVELEATRFLEGQHRSARAGQGIEYHSSVAYAEGEDAKHLDWKRFAATDRFLVPGRDFPRQRSPIQICIAFGNLPEKTFVEIDRIIPATGGR